MQLQAARPCRATRRLSYAIFAIFTEPCKPLAKIFFSPQFF